MSTFKNCLKKIISGIFITGRSQLYFTFVYTNMFKVRYVCIWILLIHWGRVTHTCISKLTNIDSYDGLSPGRRQAMIWTKAEILLIGPLGTDFIEILNEIHTFSFKKMHLKLLPGKCQPFCLGLNVLTFPVELFWVLRMNLHLTIVQNG